MDDASMPDDLNQGAYPEPRRKQGSLVWPILLGFLFTVGFVALLLGLVWFKVTNFS